MHADHDKLMLGGRREDRDGWHHVHIEGGPRERGYQHGYLLAAEIAEALRVNRYLATWDTGDEWEFFVEWAHRLFFAVGSSHYPEYIEEMKGVAEGMTSGGHETSFEDILAWNGYLELLFSWWPKHRNAPRPRPHMGDHCSAFIATKGCTAGGDIVVAHNTWDCYANADGFNVLLDILPSDGERIFMQAIPGCISSMTDFFVTSAGLLGAETTIGGFSGYDEWGVPEFYRARQALQYSRSLDEWVAAMQVGNNGGYANSWLVGDRSTGEILRLELGLQNVGLERQDEGYFWGCNIANNLKIRNQECSNPGFSDLRASGGRRERWAQFLDPDRGEFAGQVDAEIAKRMISDHFDIYHGEERPSARTICGHLELDRMETGAQAPYYPFGANDGKVVTGKLAEDMTVWARWGHACGMPFDAEEFLRQRPQYDWIRGYLKDRPSRPWAQFTAGKA